MDSNIKGPILVTGAAGRVGALGRTIVELLRQRGPPVRALVHREDECADALRATGADVVIGDLTRTMDVASCGGLSAHLLRHERVGAVPGGDRDRGRGCA